MKVPYLMVCTEVNKLYNKVFAPNAPEKEIEDHCNYISKYIEGCGWNVDEYMALYISSSEDTPALDSKLN